MADKWDYTANWPARAGDEITSAHFSDLRKKMFAIEKSLFWTADSWEDPDVWSPTRLYQYEDKVLYDGMVYILWGVESSKGDSPAKHPAWLPCARTLHRYSDYDYNSGLFHSDYLGTYPAHLRYPLDLNKYNQALEFDEYAIPTPYHHRPVPYTDWTGQRIYPAGCFIKDSSRFYECLYQHQAVESNKPAFEKDTAEWKYICGSEEELPTVGKRYEEPLEFDLTNPRFWGEIISGPVGARYLEWHSWYPWGVPPPWYFPYTAWPSSPDPNSKYYDMKRNGYQSSIECFCDRFGGKFSWYRQSTNDETEYEDLLATLRDHSGMGYWRCNRSAFEKCLSLIAGEKDGDWVKPNDRYDWYLDLRYPPDPRMYKFFGRNQLAAWRRCWRYTLHPHVDGLYWPGEWGQPPYWAENQNWWSDPRNVELAYHTYQGIIRRELSRTGGEKYHDIIRMLKRHFPMRITRDIEKHIKEDGEWDYFDEVDRYAKVWERIIQFITAITRGGMIQPEYLDWFDITRQEEELVYEMAAPVVQDMFEVLDKLKWLKCGTDFSNYSISQQADMFWGAGYPPLPPEWEPPRFHSFTSARDGMMWEGFDYDPETNFRLGYSTYDYDSFGGGDGSGVIDEHTDDEGKQFWTASPQGRKWCREIGYDVWNNWVTNLIKTADVHLVRACWHIHPMGYRHDPDDPQKQCGSLSIHGSGISYNLWTCVNWRPGESHDFDKYKWIVSDATTLADEGIVRFKIRGSFSWSAWRPGPCPSHFCAAANCWIPYLNLLFGINHRGVDLDCEPLEVEGRKRIIVPEPVEPVEEELYGS